MAKGKDVPEASRKRLAKAFSGMMKALFREEGASLRIEILQDPAVETFIDEHAKVLNSGFARTEMSDIMRQRLQESDYIFSGIKTFHELNEAFPSLLDENGARKPFERFLNDVQKVDETYNGNYLRAEYNFAQASAEMASKWESYQKDGDDYNLQYRTAGDDKVRPEHAELNGITLPPSDPFWDEYYPPNGWNCRCTVVQVLKDKYPQTDRAEAYARGQKALAKDTKGMFRFNSGKQGKAFPDYNPYTLSKCNSCTRKLDLAKGLPENELCSACLLVRKSCSSKDVTTLLEYLKDKSGKEYVKSLKEITELKIFKPLNGHKGVFFTGNDSDPDFANLAEVADKMVSHGYRVFILPNPRSTRSGDYILTKKNFFGLYDLKTVSGKNSVGNRLTDSAGQANRVILNITSKYKPKSLAREIREYFNTNTDAIDVKIIKGGKLIAIHRSQIGKNFDTEFLKRYIK